MAPSHFFEIIVFSVIRTVKILLTRVGMNCAAKRIKSKRDAVKAAADLSSTGVVPILCISSVTGEGFHPLRCFLHVLSPAGIDPLFATNLIIWFSVNTANRVQLAKEDPLFTVEELYSVPHVSFPLPFPLFISFSLGRDGDRRNACQRAIQRGRRSLYWAIPRWQL